MVSLGIHDTKTVVYGNNTGVQGTLKKDQLRNISCNLSICHMPQVMALANLLFDPMYFILDANLADACSHSETGSAEMCLPVHFTLPATFTQFIFHV